MTHTIINIRGTSGSGKTHLVRRLMEDLRGRPGNDSTLELMMAGKMRKVGHFVGDVFFVGRYDATCGGCDTMSWKGAADDVCALVLAKAEGRPVVFEGLMVSGWGTGRLANLSRAAGGALHVIQLATSLEECLASVAERRRARAAAKGQEARPLDPANTTAKWHGTRRGTELLQRAGVPNIYVLDREAAYAKARELLEC